MIIREMLEQDIEQLSILYEQFWDEKSNIEKMKKQFQKIKSSSYILLSAIDGDRLVGTITGIVCAELYGECLPFLVVENFIVDKNYRRSGIGKSLFMQLEKLAKKMNCTQVVLITEANRVDACSFYESMGFSPNANKGFKKKL